MLIAAFRTIAADQPSPLRVNVIELLRTLIATGVNVLYSSELVPPSLDAPDPVPGSDPMTRVVAALAANHLMLRPTGPLQYVVTRAPAAPSGDAAAARSAAAGGAASGSNSIPRDAPLEEVLVFASRYEFTTSTLGEPVGFDWRQFEQVPGAQEDAIRALRSAPGLATSLSARPYVRGALLDDVLVEYDGIALVEPFHFRNFQSVISVFDPSTVTRADVFTGGYPVKYGTRSGGVIDLTPRLIESGSEYSIGASLFDYEFGTAGRSQQWPIEWSLSARRSGDHSARLPLEAYFGEPNFYDVVGHIGWTASTTSSLTLGWLISDDQASLSADASNERAAAHSHDVASWLRWDWTPRADIKSHTSFAFANTERNGSGYLDFPDIAVGRLAMERSFSNFNLRSQWTYTPSPAMTWDFGGEINRETAELTFMRNQILAPPIASSFGRPSDVTVNSNQSPDSSTSGLFASARRRWQSFEAEVGMRLDTQTYRGFGTRGQLSSRFNMRYDLTENWHAYGSWGQFTQAQRIDEYRSEQNQLTPDAANRATHLIVGIAHENAAAVHWRLEAYRNYWSSLSPYFDNVLSEASLVPELQPDRVLVVPAHAEAAGIEVSGQRSFDHGLSAWALYSVSTVTDEVSGWDVPRSWDQRQAANLGLAWAHRRTSASVLLGWHSGWPSTPAALVAGAPGVPPALAVGTRNSARWGDYFSADLRFATSVPLRHGLLSLWLDASNITNESNNCCIDLTSSPATGVSAMAERIWSPRVINAGFSWQVYRAP
ncbi:MAG TPA: TonB-dependent receptor [Steroidobacteraceae bacterium]|nr:TonB-dependent receptor [Steroidobacteraceae bacterium]